MRKFLAIAVLSFLAAAPGQNAAHAQRVQRIAAIVNDDVVSVFDLQSRMQIVISSSGLKSTPQLQRRLAGQVLRRLIDERLQLQEAKRRNVTVTKSNLAAAIAQIEKQNNIPRGKFEAFMARNGIPKEAALDQVRAQLSWAKLIRRVLTPRITVGEDEIEEEFNRLKSRSGQMEYRVSEILLTVDQPEQESEIRRTAERLVDELRKGAKISAVARQFSRGASASVGGDLGWLTEDSLDGELRQIITRMEPNEIVGPVQTLSGLHILQLTQRRRAMAAPDDQTVVDLRQIVLPAPSTAGVAEVRSQTALAALLTDTVSGCDDMVRAAKEVGSAAPVMLGKTKLANLVKPLRSAIEALPVGKLSKPVRIGAGVAVFMVCERTAPKSNLPNRQEIADRMRMERLEIMARRFMRDLRSAAIVDVRV